MFREPTEKYCARQFNMTEDERLYNDILNRPNVKILDEKVSQDKIGNFVVFLKYIEYTYSEPNPAVSRQEREVDAL